MVVRQLDIEPKMEILILAAGTLFGVLVGILVVKYARPCIIWLMAVSGGMSIATGVCGILQKESGQPYNILSHTGSSKPMFSRNSQIIRVCIIGKRICMWDKIYYEPNDQEKASRNQACF